MINTIRNIIILNKNIVDMLNDMANPTFNELVQMLPKCVYRDEFYKEKYISALVFYTREDRDRAINILKQYKDIVKINYPFFYKEEYITDDMVKELNENKGDFSCWEKYLKQKD